MIYTKKVMTIYKGLNVLAIIPARGGSKTVPKKNIKLLAGKPLIAYAIKAGLGSSVVDKVIVSTDDEEIAGISKGFGAEVPFLRPKELAEDNVSDLPVFQHAIRFLEQEHRFKPDIIVHLRATTPFRTGKDIDDCVKRLVEKGAGGVRTVNPVTESPYWMDIIEGGDKLRSFIPDGRKYKRRQDLPKVYRTNGIVDAVKRDIIMNKNRMYAEEDQRAVITETLRGLEIDTGLDFFIIEQLVKKGYLKKWNIS